VYVHYGRKRLASWKTFSTVIRGPCISFYPHIPRVSVRNYFTDHLRYIPSDRAKPENSNRQWSSSSNFHFTLVSYYSTEYIERPENMIEDVFSFLRKHLLHWIEAMIILGLSNEVVRILESLYQIFQVNIFIKPQQEPRWLMNEDGKRTMTCPNFFLMLSDFIWAISKLSAKARCRFTHRGSFFRLRHPEFEESSTATFLLGYVSYDKSRGTGTVQMFQADLGLWISPQMRNC
jgi:hypothetical protein